MAGCYPRIHWGFIAVLSRRSVIFKLSDETGHKRISKVKFRRFSTPRYILSQLHSSRLGYPLFCVRRDFFCFSLVTFTANLIFLLLRSYLFCSGKALKGNEMNSDYIDVLVFPYVCIPSPFHLSKARV